MSTHQISSSGDWGPVAVALAESGWAALEDAIPAALCEVLRLELDMHVVRGELRQAAIGHHDDRVIETAIRADHILWFEGDTPAQRAWLDCMQDLRGYLNRTLYLGLQDYECHFANYGPGSYYRKHYDCFRDDDARVVTTVLYLTSGWSEHDGGQLVLYDRADDERVLCTIEPEAGTLAVFLSAVFPHEVLPTCRERASITGWFRRRPLG